MTTIEAINLLRLGILTPNEVNERYVFNADVLKTDNELAWDNAIDAEYEEVTPKQISA